VLRAAAKQAGGPELDAAARGSRGSLPHGFSQLLLTLRCSRRPDPPCRSWQEHKWGNPEEKWMAGKWSVHWRP